ncbi:MAG: hypothetical protein K9L59_13605 [Desulfobacterales bacterium]|nr:hypothetical protein [Desulfobacterales bacterium]
MAGRLGILVNSDRHPEYVLKLCQAASLRGRQVSVHFTGAGLGLAEGPLIETLEGMAHISRELHSSGRDGVPKLPCLALSEFFRRCDRTVVF